MRIFKFAIFYSFVGIYESVLFIKSTAWKFKNLFPRTVTTSRSEVTMVSAPHRMKGALLKTAFRSIL